MGRRLFFSALYVICPGMGAVMMRDAMHAPHDPAPLCFFLLYAFSFALARAAHRSTHAERAGDSPPPSLEDIVASTAREENRGGLSCVVFEQPQTFGTHADFEKILARHATIVREHLPHLLFLIRRRFRRRPYVDRVVIDVDVEPGGASRPVARGSSDTAERYAVFPSIADRLSADPGPGRTYVVLMDDDAVSLRTVAVCTRKRPSGKVARELVLADDPVLYEPVRRSVECHRKEWIRWWRATARSPQREERLPRRPPASSKEEYADRLFEACGPRLVEVLAEAKRRKRPLEEAILECGPSKRFGSFARAAAFERTEWPENLFQRWPQCDLALRRPWSSGWVPVLATSPSIGGLRWMPVDGNVDERTRPANVTEWSAGTARGVGSTS